VVFFGSPVRAEEFNIYFKASPRLELLHPYSDPATLTLLITGADGRPVAQGSLAIRLDAPKPARFFSTDFPFVEGSRLLEMTLPLRQGKAEWKYLFPIRGEYLLAVDFIAPDGRKAAKTFNFKIRENKQKWFFLGLFSLALFVFGVVAGRIFTSLGSHHAKGFAACLLLAVGGLMSSMEIVKSCQTWKSCQTCETCVYRGSDGSCLAIHVSTLRAYSIMSWPAAITARTYFPKQRTMRFS
jgi:hypothetical protein